MVFNTNNPVSTKSVYVENDTVDFTLSNVDGMAIVPNSIRLVGEININDGTNNLAIGKEVAFDTFAGVNAVCASITSSTDKQGVLETAQEYGRMVSAKTQAYKTRAQVCSSTANMTELRVGSDIIVPALMAHSASANGYSGLSDSNAYTSFSFKPDICLNKSSESISFSKTGNIHLSFRLTTNRQFLYGADSSNYKFQLKDLQVQYNTIKSSDKGKIVMDTTYMIKNSLDSGNVNLQTSVPAVCRSVSCVFHEENKLNTALYNDLATEILPDIQRVNFTFNDSNNSYIAYTLKYLRELLINYQESWGGAGKNSYSLRQIADDGLGFGIGINFKENIDMSNQKFGLQIVSGVNAARKIAVFMFFRSMIEI